MAARASVASTGQSGGSEAAPTPRLHRFDVDDYYAMARAGILTEDDRVELLDGEVVEMTPIGVAHALCVNRLTRLLSRRCADSAVVQVQNPVRLGEHSEPQPDVALLKLPLERSTHPGADDVLLLIEVADTSLGTDRDVKLPLYAQAGIAEVWLVDLQQRQIEVYREPAGASYATASSVRDGSLSPLAFPGEAIDIGEILG